MIFLEPESGVRASCGAKALCRVIVADLSINRYQRMFMGNVRAREIFLLLEDCVV